MSLSDRGACLYCDEGFGPGEHAEQMLSVGPNGQARRRWIHHECMVRTLVGSVGHQLRRCHCFGGTEEDPVGMTRREAARAAAELVDTLKPRAQRN